MLSENDDVNKNLLTSAYFFVLNCYVLILASFKPAEIMHVAKISKINLIKRLDELNKDDTCIVTLSGLFV